ncbi:MAG: hypothetical protein IT449_00465 [Phycisphaerales bacterium]|nr:hypothetical protein [Phycisphaerales bacterium]
MTVSACVCLATIAWAAAPAPMPRMANNKFNVIPNGNTSNWDVDANWSLGHKPTNTEIAEIVGSRTCVIPQNYTQAVCAGLVVNGSATLEGDSSSKIVVSGDSTIDGTVNAFHCELAISGDRTFTGDGGAIVLDKDAKITAANGSSDKLTIQGVGTPRADSLTITGVGIIEVALHNNAYVVAYFNGGDGTELRLTTYSKTGGSSGHWVAEGDDTLRVQSNVTSGSAVWELVDLAGEPAIKIGTDDNSDPACVTVTGSFTIRIGKLQVGDGSFFCTTGALVWESVDAGGGNWTSPQIVAEDALTARFGLGGASPCACP